MVYNTSDNTGVAAVKVGNTPTGVVLSVSGRLGFVGNLNSEYVSVIDLTIQAEIRCLRGLRFGQMALTADGTTIVAGDIHDNYLKFSDAATFNLVQSFDLNGQFGDDPNRRLI